MSKKQDEVYQEVMNQLGLSPDVAIEFEAVIELAYRMGRGESEQEISKASDKWMDRFNTFWSEFS